MSRGARRGRGRAGDGERAATLLGVAGALLAEMGADFKPFERQLHEATEGAPARCCGPDAYASARERGASLTLDDGLALALSAAKPTETR